MKLLISPASPYVRKARVVLRELDLLGAVDEVVVSTSPLASDPAVLAANPMGKIPALLRDDAGALFDSRVITRFLDAQAGGSLYPMAQIWDVLTLESIADGIMDATVSMAYEVRLRPEALQFPDWLSAQWQKASRAIAAINTNWMDHLHGPLTIGHIATGCALSYVDLRHDARNWRQGNDALAAWHAQFAMRPAMVATAV